LCNPVDQYPALFGGVQFFIDYPYALPNFGTGLFGAIATVLAIVFLEEVTFFYKIRRVVINPWRRLLIRSQVASLLQMRRCRLGHFSNFPE
jgi:hypothetical protein